MTKTVPVPSWLGSGSPESTSGVYDGVDVARLSMLTGRSTAPRTWLGLTLRHLLDPGPRFPGGTLHVFDELTWTARPSYATVRAQARPEWVSVKGTLTEGAVRTRIRSSSGALLADRLTVGRTATAATGWGRRALPACPPAADLVSHGPIVIGAFEVKTLSTTLNCSGGLQDDPRLARSQGFASALVPGTLLMGVVLDAARPESPSRIQTWFHTPVTVGSRQELRRSTADPDVWTLWSTGAPGPSVTARVSPVLAP